jgi:hypothetical protein
MEREREGRRERRKESEMGGKRKQERKEIE